MIGPENNISPADNPEEEQRRRDEADAEKLRRLRGLLNKVEIKRFTIEEYLRSKRQEESEK
ncbi:hypothetical protein HYS84_00060 [Candidatus Saccharibacteria bacterium]|nr:hypothetical protein [Candidatus Saccharibacteria bacterium]